MLNKCLTWRYALDKANPRRSMWFLIGVAVLCVGSAGLLGCPQAGVGTIGSDACLGCHNGQNAPLIEGFDKSEHAVIGCEGCHGPGGTHASNGGTEGWFITRFSKKPFDKAHELCAKCHEAKVKAFLATPHELKEAATCLDCHDVHKSSNLAQNACTKCHALPTTGAVHNQHVGGVSCSVCHDVHTTASAPQQACTKCHEASGEPTLHITHQKKMTCTACHDFNPGGAGAIKSCDTCHAKQSSSFPQSKHAAATNCNTCHNMLKAWPKKSVDVCDKCHAIEVEQYLLSDHAKSGEVHCEDCHDPHSGDRVVRPTKDNQLCLKCHAAYGFANDAEISAHTYHTVDPAGSGASRCSTCHLPPLNRTNQAAGAHEHSLRTLAPITSNQAAKAGITPVPPNSCSGVAGCHDGTVPQAPVYDVDLLEINTGLQSIYEARYGTTGESK